jgi:hypothetical protein
MNQTITVETVGTAGTVERLARLNVVALMWAFLAVGALFFLVPDGVVAFTNRIGSWLGDFFRGSWPIDRTGVSCSSWSAVYVGCRDEAVRATAGYLRPRAAGVRRYRRTTVRAKGPRSTASFPTSKSRPSRSSAKMMRQSRWATATTAIL